MSEVGAKFIKLLGREECGGVRKRIRSVVVERLEESQGKGVNRVVGKESR